MTKERRAHAGNKTKGCKVHGIGYCKCNMHAESMKLSLYKPALTRKEANYQAGKTCKKQ